MSDVPENVRSDDHYVTVFVTCKTCGEQILDMGFNKEGTGVLGGSASEMMWRIARQKTATHVEQHRKETRSGN